MNAQLLAKTTPLAAPGMHDRLLVRVFACFAAGWAITAFTMLVARTIFDVMGLAA